MGVRVQVFQRQALDVRESCIAQTAHRAIGDVVVAKGKQPLRERCKRNDNRHARSDLRYACKIHGARMQSMASPVKMGK